MARAALLLGLVAAASAGLYPDDLFDVGKSTMLDSETFDDYVSDRIDEGRTTFVRFVASEG